VRFQLDILSSNLNNEKEIRTLAETRAKELRQQLEDLQQSLSAEKGRYQGKIELLQSEMEKRSSEWKIQKEDLQSQIESFHSVLTQKVKVSPRQEAKEVELERKIQNLMEEIELQKKESQKNLQKAEQDILLLKNESRELKERLSSEGKPNDTIESMQKDLLKTKQDLEVARKIGIELHEDVERIQQESETSSNENQELKKQLKRVREESAVLKQELLRQIEVLVNYGKVSFV